MPVPPEGSGARPGTPAPDDYQVYHDADAARFQVRAGTDVALLQYRRVRDRIVFVHTEVPEPLRGRGIADKLAHAGLEYARENGLAVVPRCPFVAAYIQRHPEYEPLVQPL